jgi:hypothetical protein
MKEPVIFFTKISSNSLAKNDECKDFIFKHFSQLKRSNKLSPGVFEFAPVLRLFQVERLISKLDTSTGAGLVAIPTKVIRSAPSLIPVLTKLFNLCIASNYVPLDWKSACVTPLYKNKGDKNDINNYRGISVLPPIAKIFEKLLAAQIIYYLEINNLLFVGQHGFRAGHSCETALHEIINDMNEIKHLGLIGLFLFIDFRKAFDLVDSDLLLNKLFHYGFANNALDLIRNYFSDRQQLIKFGETRSSFSNMKLGVPQGSVLGPLFFLLFINDLAFYVKSFECKLFADDTTLYLSNKNLDCRKNLTRLLLRLSIGVNLTD